MEKINVAELLKDCPSGMELDCTMYDTIFFYEITDDPVFPIRMKRIDGPLITLTKYGEYANSPSAKCVIFPKGKTTWEGFVPPSKFKNGDVVYTNGDSIAILSNGIGFRSEAFNSCCGLYNYEFDTDVVVSPKRFATEEEKEKLFQAIKDNGYRWNTETKTLEKLIEPKFKVGNRIKHIKTGNIYEIIKILLNCYTADYFGSDITILFNKQDEYELVPDKFDITTLKPFESKVLTRDDGYSLWQPGIWGFYDKEHRFSYVTIGCRYRQCIPYEGNEHLLGTADECDEYFKTWK